MDEKIVSTSDKDILYFNKILENLGMGTKFKFIKDDVKTRILDKQNYENLDMPILSKIGDVPFNYTEKDIKDMQKIAGIVEEKVCFKDCYDDFASRRIAQKRSSRNLTINFEGFTEEEIKNFKETFTLTISKFCGIMTTRFNSKFTSQ